MKRDPQWSRGTELEIQTRALLQEVERQKLVHLTEIRDDYKASFEEEQKNAVRKLHAEKSALILENEALKKKLDEEPMTAQREVRRNEFSLELKRTFCLSERTSRENSSIERRIEILSGRTGAKESGLEANAARTRSMDRKIRPAERAARRVST